MTPVLSKLHDISPGFAWMIRVGAPIIGFIITVDESIIGAESSDEEEGRTEIASV